MAPVESMRGGWKAVHWNTHRDLDDWIESRVNRAEVSNTVRTKEYNWNQRAR
jgi:hypothetical protein